MAEDQASGRTRVLKLLRELQQEQERVRSELRDRLAELEKNAASHAETHAQHQELLTESAQDIAQLREALTGVAFRMEEQRLLLIAQAEKIEALSDARPPSISLGFFLRRKFEPTGNIQEQDMTDTTAAGHEALPREDWRSISWSSIIFGALIALAISLALKTLGLGVSASSVDTSSRATDAISTAAGVGGIWSLVSTAIALFIGGFVASTLAHTFTGKRAAIYGLGVWSLTTLISTAVIVPALVRGTGDALTAAGTVVDRTLGAVGAGASQATSNLPAGLADRIQRTLIGTPPSGQQVDQGAVQEITSLIGQRITQGDWTPQQRTQLNSAVARAAGISQDDARRRVDEAQDTINFVISQAQEKARQAAEAAREAVATAAYSAFAAMLLGLIGAILGARYGELEEEELPTFARVRLGPQRDRHA
jgi:hypothetical protein